LKLTTDRHEPSCGLFETAELLVPNTPGVYLERTATVETAQAQATVTLRIMTR